MTLSRGTNARPSATKTSASSSVVHGKGNDPPSPNSAATAMPTPDAANGAVRRQPAVGNQAAATRRRKAAASGLDPPHSSDSTRTRPRPATQQRQHEDAAGPTLACGGEGGDAERQPQRERQPADDQVDGTDDREPHDGDVVAGRRLAAQQPSEGRRRRDAGERPDESRAEQRREQREDHRVPG